jgi:hypothetical protein
MILGVSLFSHNILASNIEPCQPTTISSSNYFSSPANGVYGCTIRQSKNGLIVAWMWADDSAILSKDRHKMKYAFDCGKGITKLLERELSELEDEDWVKPKPHTTADKWLRYICVNSKFL